MSAGISVACAMIRATRVSVGISTAKLSQKGADQGKEQPGAETQDINQEKIHKSIPDPIRDMTEAGRAVKNYGGVLI